MKKIIALLLSVLFVPFFAEARASALSAKAAVLLNGDTGEIIYSKNCDMPLPMASTTKIMTALLLCESGNLNRSITVTKEMVAVEGSSMGLLVGDTVRLYDLLYGMMLASGNDAANTTAIALSGSVEKFAERMNARAKEMGLKNTHFVTPSGLDAKGHQTTAYELGIIAMHALKNKDFAAAAASKSATLHYGNPPYDRTLTNHNRLLKSYDDVVGVKTGFTKKSGRCLVSAARKDGKLVIAVTLNDPNDWADHRSLLDTGLAAISSVELVPSKEKATVSVIGGNSKNIEINFKSDSINLLSYDDIRCEINIPDFLYAPIEKGEKIGEIAYYNGDELLKCEDITSPKKVSRKGTDKTKRFIDLFKYIIKSV